MSENFVDLGKVVDISGSSVPNSFQAGRVILGLQTGHDAPER